MKRIIIGVFLFVLFLCAAGISYAEPKILGKTVEYSAQGVVMKSYLAYDEQIKGERPGVLVVPEVWGLNDYSRKRGRMLAELGYTALAVDMYGDGKVATNFDDASKLYSEMMKNFDVVKVRFLAAMDFLKRQPTVAPARIAAIGYCFGGTVVLSMAGQGVDLKGVASFHGGLGDMKPPQPGSVKAKILVLHGGADKLVTPEQVEAFKREMKSAGADFRFISYPGAMHSFTNPEATEIGRKLNVSAAYNADADKNSWAAMEDFLKKLFKV
jgi:dienelactone hydrolase